MGTHWLKRISDFLARMPGLPIVIAVGLVVLNFVVQLLPAWPVVGWMARTHLLLHLALILGFVGLLVGDAL
jgi:hypothetical protein